MSCRLGLCDDSKKSLWSVKSRSDEIQVEVPVLESTRLTDLVSGESKRRSVRLQCSRQLTENEDNMRR